MPATRRSRPTSGRSVSVTLTSAASQSTTTPSRTAPANSSRTASSSFTLHLPGQADQRALRRLAGRIGGRLVEGERQLVVAQTQLDRPTIASRSSGRNRSIASS